MTTLGTGVKDARLVDVGSEEYHQIDAVSNSMLKAFSSDVETCHERYVLKVADQKESKAFDFGKRLERIVFFDEQPNAVVVPQAALSQRKKPGTDNEFTYAKSGPAWAEFKTRMETEHGPDVLLLKQDEFDKEIAPLLIAVERLRQHEAANKLLWGDGDPHQTILWTDTSMGFDLPCKCQLDLLSKRGVIIDLKSCSPAMSRDDFAYQRAVWGFKYHWQAWWYRHAVKALTGESLPFVFVFVQSEAPFRVRVWELDEAWLELAEVQVRETLGKLGRCWQSGVWLPEHFGEVERLPILPWAQRSMEEELL